MGWKPSKVWIEFYYSIKYQAVFLFKLDTQDNQILYDYKEFKIMQLE